MHPASCTNNTHCDVTDLVNHELVEQKLENLENGTFFYEKIHYMTRHRQYSHNPSEV